MFCLFCFCHSLKIHFTHFITLRVRCIHSIRVRYNYTYNKHNARQIYKRTFFVRFFIINVSGVDEWMDRSTEGLMDRHVHISITRLCSEIVPTRAIFGKIFPRCLAGFHDRASVAFHSISFFFFRVPSFFSSRTRSILSTL